MRGVTSPIRSSRTTAPTLTTPVPSSANWKKQIQVDLFCKPRKLFFTNFSWQDGDVLKETSREQIAEAYFALNNESKRWDQLVYHCEDSLLNDPHPICTRAQIDALKTMNKEVTKRKVHLASFCTYLNKLEWEYKFPPRWVPTTCDLDAVSFYNDSFPSGEHEAMITTTLAFRLVEAVDEITSVAWYPAWVQSLILTSRVWNLRTGNEKHIKVWREMAAKSQWVGRVPPVKFRKLFRYRLKVFLRARRESLKNLLCIDEQGDDGDEVDDEETLCDWKDEMVIVQALGLRRF